MSTLLIGLIATLIVVLLYQLARRARAKRRGMW
jgi:hypothetical protein